MSFEATVKTLLQASTGLSALVGQGVYPVLTPQRAAYPACTYQVVYLDEVPHFTGRSDTLRHYLLQIDCWARDMSVALEMDAAVRSAMDGGAASLSCVLRDSDDDYEEETKLYRSTLSYSCWFNDPEPDPIADEDGLDILDEDGVEIMDEY